MATQEEMARDRQNRPAFTLEMRCEDGGGEDVPFDTDDQGAIESHVEEWVREGEWGDQGAIVSGWWALRDAGGDEVSEGRVEVEIEPDHDALIRKAGGDPDCEHDWHGEGGIKENPGVWSRGGTHMLYVDRCRACGLKRTYNDFGCQRNPGQCDTVGYEMPGRWCGECRSEECRCEPGRGDSPTQEETTMTMDVTTNLGAGILTRDDTGKPVVRVGGRDYGPAEVESVSTKTLGDDDAEEAKLVEDARAAGYMVFC